MRAQVLSRRLLGLLIICLSSWIGSVEAAYRYEFDAACAKAYRTIIELRLKDGRAQLAQIRDRDPENLAAVWLEDYADFFEIYIDEDEKSFARLEKDYHERLRLLRQGPEDSPYYRYTQANVMLHWALARLKFGEYVGTMREARKAYKLLVENLQLHPDFVLSRKELGLLQAAVATVPSGYQWGLEFLTGMEGDLAGGKRNLERVLKELRRDGSPFLQEATALYAFLLLNLEREEDEAWRRISAVGFDESRNLMAVFVKANIAMRTGRNDEAIRLLSQRPHSPSYYPFPYLDFMHGVCLQRKLSPQAGVYLRSFIREKVTGNFIKEAYQKLAWQELLAGRIVNYKALMGKVRSSGTTVAGSDVNAQREANAEFPPNVDLLRARLLFDGGYYARAEEAISAVIPAFLSAEQKIEYPYRAARIAAKRGQTALAESRYKNVIAIGRNSPAYFACKSAVELGAIAEGRGERKAARAYFELALQMRPSEYAPDLHQQAKAGLARLK